ncbi:hypothetical protein pb186bvf_009711 [Paramecium bursaria]
MLENQKEGPINNAFIGFFFVSIILFLYTYYNYVRINERLKEQEEYDNTHTQMSTDEFDRHVRETTRRELQKLEQSEQFQNLRRQQRPQSDQFSKPSLSKQKSQ